MHLQTALNTYATLMEAIKQRIALIQAIAMQDVGLPPFAAAELAQLQVRMTCETFALACLVAHGDIEETQTARLASAYQADFIMNALEKLHPRFYPQPTQQVRDNEKTVGWRPIKDGFLTKEELLKTYRSTFDFLHAGDLRRILSSAPPRQILATDLLIFAKGLMVLLSHHNILLADPPGEQPIIGPDGLPAPRRQMVVLLNGEGKGNVQATLFLLVKPENLPPDHVPPKAAI